MKRCAKCGEEKPHSSFSPAKDGSGDKNGLRSQCKPCRAVVNRTWHEKNVVRSRDNHARWMNDNRDSERVKSRARASAMAPEIRAELARDWRRRNVARNAAKASRYRARQLRATPAWLSNIHRAQVEEFYEIAAARSVQTGIEHHVDHIEPLKGDKSLGLHVPWNLQVLTATDNLSKKNRM